MSLTETAQTAAPAADWPVASCLPLPPPAGRTLLDVEIDLRHAGRRRVQLAVEWVGASTAPAVWVAGGISAHRHLAANGVDPAEGWWQDAVGPGRALDPQQHRLLAFDWVGADGSIDAPIDTHDQAAAIAAVLDALGIATLHAFVGASYGAMVAQAFAVAYPQRVGRLVLLSAAHRPHPYASAFRALQRQVVALGQLQCADEVGLSLARQFAMLSYRTPQEFGARFDAPVALEGQHARCAAEDYLEACGRRYVARWNATAFLRLSESIDLHRVDPAAITVPTTLFSVEQDWLAPPDEIQTFADAINAPVTLTRIASAYGHDAFLKETAAVDTVLRSALG